MRRTSLLSALGFTLLASLAVGCARGPDVQAPALGLRRVVIYRNGVAYFERAGKVQTDQVTFRVRNEKVGDFLATLAVMEQGGSSVRSASFPVDLDKDKDDDADEEQVDPRYEILLKPPIAAKKADKQKDKLEKVTLTLDGLEHDLLVGYVAETPVWRPSYRLVIDDPKATGGAAAAKAADLQVWGIVQNQSGENWKGITLSLVAGAPLAFQATLDKPVIPVRPIVSDQGEVFGSIPTGETSLAEAPPPPPAPPPMWASTPSAADVDNDGLEDQKDAQDESPGYYKSAKKMAEATAARAPAAKGTGAVGRFAGPQGGCRERRPRRWSRARAASCRRPRAR